MYLGSHVSIKNGYFEAAKTAYAMGSLSFQYFAKNPRSLSVKSFDVKDTDKCAAFTKKNQLLSIVHTAYPTNLAIENEPKKELTMRSILNDLEIADACHSIGVVVHFGKYKGKNPLNGYKNIINMLNNILNQWQGNAMILLENQAGQGSQMGITLEELVQVRSLSEKPEKIGFCFDTCHAYTSGMWKDNGWNVLYEKGLELNYFSNVKAVHLNDSMYPHGSLRDRHANIGKGYIGEVNMKQLLKSPFLENIPVILETPQTELLSHRTEIEMVRNEYL